MAREKRDYDNGENVLVRFVGIAAETEKAYCLVREDEDIWIPKSQVRHIDEDGGEIWIPVWLAEKKDLEYE